MATEADAKPVRQESLLKSDEVVIPDYLKGFLETIATREGFSDGFRVVYRPGSSAGDGFMGVMLSVVIAGLRHGFNDELVLVCKTPPVTGLRKQFAANAFKQEIKAYETYLPALVQFQREKGISESDGFFAFPKCYGTYTDEENLNYAIVLEDLRHTGFRMWNKHLPIDYRHVQLVIGQLAKLHALSFALRQQRPDVFAQFQTIGSPMFRHMTTFPGVESYYEDLFDRTIESLDPSHKEEIRKITHLRHHYRVNFRASTSGAEAEPFTVFCHGDSWNNNMMFQYNSVDSVDPQRVVVLDWQLSQYCSPVTDLTYYLYSSTEQPLRTAHFDDILHGYHSNLAELLHQLGGDVNAQFSYDHLQGQLRTFAIYGMIMAPILVHVMTAAVDELPDFDEITEENSKEFDYMAKGCQDAYKVRLRDVVRDFVARGYFGEQHLALREVTEEEQRK